MSRLCVFFTFQPTFDGPSRPRRITVLTGPVASTRLLIFLLTFIFLSLLFHLSSSSALPVLILTSLSMSTPLELQLMESHRQLLNTYLGSLSPEQLRAAILSQASSGPEAMLASVHLLTSNNINKPNNPIQGALVPILPMTITTAPASSSRVDQFVVPAPNVGGDQTMKEKERNDNIAQGESQSRRTGPASG